METKNKLQKPNGARYAPFVFIFWIFIAVLVFLYVTSCHKVRTPTEVLPNDITLNEISIWLSKFESGFKPDSVAESYEFKNNRAVNFYTYYDDTTTNIIFTIHKLSQEMSLELIGDSKIAEQIFINESPDIIFNEFNWEDYTELQTKSQDLFITYQPSYFKLIIAWRSINE